MNILFICNEYPPGKAGGIGSATKTLSKAISESGHKVFVAGLYPPGYGEKDYEEDHGIKVWRKRLAVDFGLIRNNYSVFNLAIVRVLSVTRIMQMDVMNRLFLFNKFLIDIIDKFDIDIIEWPDFNEFFAYVPDDFSWPSLPVPLVIKFHGTASYINRQLGRQPDRKIFEIEKNHINRADGLIAVSKKTAEDYADLYNIRKEIITLYNSIEVTPFSHEWHQSQKTIVYAGALTQSKGIYSLLMAWHLVAATDRDAVLKICGKGKYEPLKAFLSPEVKSSVVFEGFVDRDRLYETFRHAAGSIFPSYAESFAMAPLEAMAIGCPVIYTTRASGPELITSGINGLLVDPDNIEEMANAMLLLLKNEEIRKKFSLEGRATIEERFNICQSAANHIHFYSQLIQQHAKTKNCA